MSTRISSEWRTLDEFAGGMDTNRAPSTDRLAGRTLTVTFDDGRVVRQVFEDATTMRWTEDGRETTETYDAVEIADDVYFVDLVRRGTPRDSVSQVVGTRTRTVLAVESSIAAENVPDVPQVSQRLVTGVVGDASDPPSTPPPAPTRELIGKRALYRYSPGHLYEHIYLNSVRYCWQCLVGAQRGHGDVDLADMYKFDDGIYVVCWQEFRIPVGCVWVYNWEARRTTGKFFGLSGDGVVENSPGGAYITVLPDAGYPEGVEPA